MSIEAHSFTYFLNIRYRLVYANYIEYVNNLPICLLSHNNNDSITQYVICNIIAWTMRTCG